MKRMRRFLHADPETLREQYRDSRNLGARLDLHDRFSQNAQGWHRWVFEQLELAPDARVLELGCGAAALWARNLEVLPAGWEVTLSDFSVGMLDDARAALGPAGPPFHFESFDAASIPRADASFDAVIANHMLYHVQDRERALGQIRRVLRPGGQLYAATNGEHHIEELDALVERFAPGRGMHASSSFSLENAAAQLDPWFDRLELRRYEDGLVVTESEPLIAYVLSAGLSDAFDADALATLRAFIDAHIRREGAFRVTKQVGLFIASLDS